jgi:hypothetical protein
MNDARLFAVVCGDSVTSDTNGKTTFNAKVHLNTVILLNYLLFRQATQSASLRIEPSEENAHYMETRAAAADLQIIFSDDVEFVAEIAPKDFLRILSEETTSADSMATFSQDASSASAGDSISAGAAAGIAIASTIGAIALVALVIGGVVVLVKRRTVKQQLRQRGEGHSQQMDTVMV